MKLAVNGKELEVTISDDLNFEGSRELISSCKAHLKQHKDARIKINLDELSKLRTCAIGAILVITDWSPDRCQINLRRCAADVHEVFDVCSLDKHLKDISLCSPMQNCYSCFENNGYPVTENCSQTAINTAFIANASRGLIPNE